jgi:hypothetical protein
LIEYLEKHARKDGGYGWEGQERGHLTPTFAVVGCYKLLGEKPPKVKAVAEFIRTHHPRELKGRLEQEHREFEWQQIQSLVWLGEDVSGFRDVVKSWKGPIAYLKQYERNGYPVFQQEVSAILSWKLVALPVDEIPVAFIEYLNSRRRASGSFNNTPAIDGSDGHVLNTWWGLQALAALESERQPVDWKKNPTAAWLKKCRFTNGAFGYQPASGLGDLDDVTYTWAAVRSLKILGAGLDVAEDCVRYLYKLLSRDGGFADRPEWLSNPLATYYALDALAALGALDAEPYEARAAQKLNMPSIPLGLKVFSIQIEAHGQGSPAEAVDLAAELRIHLWGAKNAKPEWLARARAIARQQGEPVNFFLANEEYGSWITVPGMGTYSHMSDVIAPADANIGPSVAGQTAATWETYRVDRLLPLVNRGGRLIWQFGENEPLVRMLLDNSLLRGGYSAISTYHFGNPDFTNTEPFLMRYRGQIPFVALQDAHGVEPWWFADMTEGFRTLFLATKPTWEGWLQALRNNWVVAVRHDSVSSGETWMHGMPEVIDEVKRQWRQWQWWDNPGINRPLVSIVALRPADEFEVGRPEKGIAIRVRCAWENTTQGLPKKPITELVKLLVAGKEVTPDHVIRRRPNDAMEDDYYLYEWPDPPAGTHRATATVRKMGTREESWRHVEFTV